jgi:purine-nucleoside phosphorylase
VELEHALAEAGAFLHQRIASVPQVAIILGTGLSPLGDRFAVPLRIPYAEIPHFPVSTVESHQGTLAVGSWQGREVALLQGRVHYYEGYSLQEITFPVRVLRKLGASLLVVTNAAGGLNPAFAPGDLMAITDHLNLMGDNPLRGENLGSLGIRFPSMHEPYRRRLIGLVEKAAHDLGISLRAGVYAAVSGPSMETAAETRFLRMIGADAVGMSTVPEVIAAVHAGMEVVGISVIANVNNPENLAPALLEDVLATVRRAEPALLRLIGGFLARLDG